MTNFYDNSPIDKKSIRKLNSVFNYIAIEVEYRKWIENGGVNEKEDALYKHLCLLTDKNGMATTTVRYLIKTTRLAYRYLLGGKRKDKNGNTIEIGGCLDSLQNKGLIKYEKRGAENYLAVQILQVPKWEIAKHRFITIKNTVIRPAMTQEQYDATMAEFQAQLAIENNQGIKDFIYRRMATTEKEWIESQKSAVPKKRSN